MKKKNPAGRSTHLHHFKCPFSGLFGNVTDNDLSGSSTNDNLSGLATERDFLDGKPGIVAIRIKVSYLSEWRPIVFIFLLT